MYKTLIFDLDGTLLDTSKDIQKVLNDTLKEFNCPTLSLSQTLSFIGNGAYALCRDALPFDKQNLLEEFHKSYVFSFQNCDNALTSVFPDEKRVLQRFVNDGIKVCILTNKPQIATERVVKQYLDFIDFDIVFGNRPDFSLKPNPESVKYIIDNLGVNEKECLFIGDGEADVMTAINAGIDGVSVLWGYRNKEQLIKYGAKNFVESFDDLARFVYDKN